MAELSEETEGVTFGKVDIDDNDEAANMAGIKSIPTFKFYQVSELFSTHSWGDWLLYTLGIQDSVAFDEWRGSTPAPASANHIFLCTSRERFGLTCS